MRTFTLPLLAALSLTAANTASAADLDYDYLRGAEYDPAPAPVVDWSGAYFGGHGGFSSSSFGFSNTAQPIISNYLRQTSVESQYQVSTFLSAPTSKRMDGGAFGAYAGYNAQFDDIVLGVEVDYTHSRLGASSYKEIGRSLNTSDGYYNIVNLSNQSSTKITDYATLRARAGHAWGNLLPYVTGGLAIGSAQISDRVTVQSAGYDQTTYKANQAITSQGTSGSALPAYVASYGYSSFNQAYPGSAILADPYVYNRTKTKTVAGVAAGAGIEYAITQNVLLRAEYQYVLFNAFDGHKANVNTIRGGAAVKF